MFNKKKQELMDKIIVIRNNKKSIDIEYKRLMVEYYILTGAKPEQAVKMV